MTKAKAKKRLKYAIESLEFWREEYVKNERDKNTILDIRSSMLSKKTNREELREEALANIKEAKDRIAELQRIAM